MQSQTKTALAEEVRELLKPLKIVLCWIVGHNWLSSRYNPLLGIGGTGNVGGAENLDLA